MFCFIFSLSLLMTVVTATEVEIKAEQPSTPLSTPLTNARYERTFITFTDPKDKKKVFDKPAPKLRPPKLCPFAR